MKRLVFLTVASVSVIVLLAPTALAQTPISCDGFVSYAGYRSQWGAQQYYDFNATPEERAILDTDGDGFACDGWSSGVDALGIQGGESGYWGSDGYYYYY